MTIAQLQYYRRKKGYSYKKIAELSGIPLSTVQKVLGGQTTTPRYETLQALEKVLIDDENAYEEKELNTEQSQLKDESVYGTGARAFKQKYTVKDYYALTDERRVELINGCFYDMTAPSPIHQIISGEVWNALKKYIDQKQGKCIPFYAPTDVMLDEDESTMVQPDVFVVCDRKKITGTCIIGAPDFVVEVLSKATRKKDMTVKLAKYQSAGVKEYWIVDVAKKRIFVYVFDSEDEFVTIYGFEDQVPVSIYGGDLQMDFQKITKRIEGLELTL